MICDKCRAIALKSGDSTAVGISDFSCTFYEQSSQITELSVEAESSTTSTAAWDLVPQCGATLNTTKAGRLPYGRLAAKEKEK